MSDKALVDRVDRFAREIRDLVDNNNNNASGTNADGGQGSSSSGHGSASSDDGRTLMNFFRCLLEVEDEDDLLPSALNVVSHVERVDNVLGAVSNARRAKSIVERWLARPEDDGPMGDDPLVSRPVLIERDTIVMVDVKVGTGASRVTVADYYRVVNIFDKYYNKWFMSKEKSKKWKGEERKYKLEVRMLKKKCNRRIPRCGVVWGRYLFEEGYSKDCGRQHGPERRGEDAGGCVK